MDQRISGTRFVLVWFALGVAGLLPAGTVRAQVTVCASGCTYTTIQAAVDAVAVGTTINVQPGTYAEDVTVSKRVTLVGASGAIAAILGAFVREFLA